MPGEPVHAGPKISSARGPRVRAFTLLFAGLVLVAAAVRTAISAAPSHEALHALSGAPRLSIALLLGLPLANLLLTAATFLVLTNRHGRVRMAEMTALIA